MGAARGEPATGRSRESGRYLPGNGHERRLPLVAAKRRETVQQPACIRVARVREHLPDRSLLDELARIHDADPIADPYDRTEIVADEEHGRAVAPAKLTDEVEHGRLHRHVEASGGLIHDQERVLGDHACAAAGRPRAGAVAGTLANRAA
jgi:hypothetical protein